MDGYQVALILVTCWAFVATYEAWDAKKALKAKLKVTQDIEWPNTTSKAIENYCNARPVVGYNDSRFGETNADTTAYPSWPEFNALERKIEEIRVDVNNQKWHLQQLPAIQKLLKKHSEPSKIPVGDLKELMNEFSWKNLTVAEDYVWKVYDYEAWRDRVRARRSFA